MYYIIFYHWVYDDHVYRDEQQRQYVTTNILMTSYFNCRPVFIFDIRIKFEKNDITDKLVDYLTVAVVKEDCRDDSTDEDTSDDIEWNENQPTLVNFNSDLNDDDDISAYSNEDDDRNIDSDTNDEVDAGHDDTETLL